MSERGRGALRRVHFVPLRGGWGHLSVYWDARDLWWGLFWDMRYDDRHNGYLWRSRRMLYVWICLVPTLPLRLAVPWPWPAQEKKDG